MDDYLDPRAVDALRLELARTITQIEQCENGPEDLRIENAIYAAHKKNQMIAQLRARIVSLRELIAACEHADINEPEARSVSLT